MSIQRRNEQLGSCASAWGKVVRGALEKSCAKNAISKHLYVDADSFDETPMKIAHKDSSEHASPSTAVAATTAVDVPKTALALPSSCVMQKEVAPSKIVNSFGGFGMLLGVASEDPAAFAGEELVAVVAPPPFCSDVQLLDACKGEALCHLAEARNGCSLAARCFDQKLRMAGVDRHPSNDLCERLVVHHRGGLEQTHFSMFYPHCRRDAWENCRVGRFNGTWGHPQWVVNRIGGADGCVSELHESSNQ